MPYQAEDDVGNMACEGKDALVGTEDACSDDLVDNNVCEMI
jgi:hypothetical protein